MIESLQGGLNEDAPDGIADDQCTVTDNTETVVSKLGERRLGCLEIDLTGSGITDFDEVVWSHRHTPSPDLAETAVYLLAYKYSPPEAKFVGKDSGGWFSLVPSDAINLDYVYQVRSVSFDGKLFIAYKSLVDRLHVIDDNGFRRTGIAAPDAPGVADTGTPGVAYTGTRYVRVRFVDVEGTAVTRRSEPSATTTFTPSGTGTAARVTQPLTGTEPYTHWEVEFSLDDATFYRIARLTNATLTYDDSTAFTDGYRDIVGAALSEEIGSYNLIPSVEHLAVDDDRLVGGGSFEDPLKSSRITWTVARGDLTGVGNSERIPLATTNIKDLDTLQDGGITGLIGGITGYIFATKFGHAYRLNRTGTRSAAYDAICITKVRGAIPGSLVAAVDVSGNPMVYGLDPDIGPWRLGADGLEPCGLDIQRVTWPTVNLDATNVPAVSCYFPENRQIHWWVPTGDEQYPDTRLVLHVDRQRKVANGWRGGWRKWTGPSARALTACLFSTNIDDDSFVDGSSKALVPFIGVVGAEAGGLFWQTTIGSDDNGTAYAARIVTKPYMHGALLHQFKCEKAVLLAKAEDGAAIAVTAIVDFGLVQKLAASIDLSPVSSEEWVMRKIDDIRINEARAVQFMFEDVDGADTPFQLERFGVLELSGKRA